MKNPLAQSPTIVRCAVGIIVATPVLLSIIGFRLYAYPNNPNAWLILGVFGLLYSLLGAALLAGSNVVRWLWTAWIGFGWVKLVLFFPPSMREYTEPMITVFSSFTVHTIAIGLLFVPASNRYFTRKKSAEPGATDNPDGAQHLREDH